MYITHGTPPELFNEYIEMLSLTELRLTFRTFKEQIAFVGHTHKFEIYELTAKKYPQKHAFPAEPFNLNSSSRYIISAGSVGQPRYPNIRPGYLIYDSDKQQIEKHEFDYNVELTFLKIIDAGLPEQNGRRLRIG